MKALEDMIARAREVVLDIDFTAVKQWKKNHPGSACVGFFPVYVPQEVIHAAGALPVAIWGGGEKIEIELADARVQSFICSISRSTLELGLTGRLEFLDGMLFGALCDVARNMSGVWARNFPDMYTDYLHYPQNLKSDAAQDYYLRDLQRLAAEVGKLTGVTVHDARLARSIEIYEEQRELLRSLSKLREEEPWRLSLEEFQVLVRAAGRRDPEEYNQELATILEALPQREVRAADGVRVVLEGSFCEQPSLGLLRTLDEAHCFVVDSDLGRGVRWFKHALPPDKDPWKRLVAGYFHHAEASIVRHKSPSERSLRLVERVRQSKAEGVIFCTAKFCEPAFYDFVLHKRALEEEHIPFMAFEFEEKMSSFETVRTQAETFSESILFFTEEVSA